jgi:hypothetical protein
LTAGTGITSDTENKIAAFDGDYNRLSNRLNAGTGITIDTENKIAAFNGLLKIG